MTIQFDLHTHHERCGHAEGSIEDYIQSAIKKGMQVIGISDHSPFFASEEDQPHPRIAMSKSEFPQYVQEVLRLKQTYQGQIEVLLGVESDFFPDQIDVYKQAYAPYPFDYIIGSVHNIEGKSIFNKKRWNGLSRSKQIQVKELYYESIQRSAKSGMFDILGHIDAMKAYYPAFSDLPTDAVEQTLKVIADHDIAIEINTSGKTKYVGGWYPSDEILERAHYYGVHVTFGSDAHIPERVGDEWDLVVTKLREIGFTEWVYFRQRKRQVVPIQKKDL